MKPWIALVFFFTVSCAVVPELPESLASRQPRVIDILPAPASTVSSQPSIVLYFSEPIDPASVEAGSVILSEGQVDLKQFESTTKLLDAVDDGQIAGVPLTYTLRGDGRVLVIASDQSLRSGSDYSLLVTSRVRSMEQVPFNQDPASDVRAYLVDYRVSDRAASPDFSQESPGEASGSGESGLGEGPVEEEPADLPPEVEAAPEEELQDGTVVLNEIFYDASGGDTNGDLFIELFGPAGYRVGDFQIRFVNGDNGSVYDTMTLPASTVLPADGFYVIADAVTGSSTVTHVLNTDLIDNFDPQNGPDAIQLLDASGDLLDAVGYGDGITPLSEDGLPALEGAAAPDVIGGHSLERAKPGLDTDSNADDFIDQGSPSPGL